jgi:hypothetical protein
MITVAFGIPIDRATGRRYYPIDRVNNRPRRDLSIQNTMLLRSQAIHRRRTYRMVDRHRSGLHVWAGHGGGPHNDWAA